LTRCCWRTLCPAFWSRQTACGYACHCPAGEAPLRFASSILTTRIYTSAPQCRWPPHSYATPTPPRAPTSRALPCPLCADDRRRDRASALVGDASSRRLCSPRSGTEAAANPVSGLRAPPRRTQDAVDTCGQRGYAALDRARGGAPGALHSKSGLCEPERTPAVRPRPSRAAGGDADGASPCAAEPCEPRQVGRSSGKRPASGATRVLGRSHHPRHGRPGRDNACARSLPPCVTPPPRTWHPPASRRPATQPSTAPHDAPP